MVGRSQVVQKWRRLIVDILFALPGVVKTQWVRFASFTSWHTREPLVFVEARALSLIRSCAAWPVQTVVSSIVVMTKLGVADVLCDPRLH